MKNNDQALSAFLAAMGGVNEQLERLQAAADDHLGNGPDEIRWGHVGSANHLLELLTEAADFICGTAE
jgi:hypothetical protein